MSEHDPNAYPPGWPAAYPPPPEQQPPAAAYPQQGQPAYPADQAQAYPGQPQAYPGQPQGYPGQAQPQQGQYQAQPYPGSSYPAQQYPAQQPQHYPAQQPQHYPAQQQPYQQQPYQAQPQAYPAAQPQSYPGQQPYQVQPQQAYQAPGYPQAQPAAPAQASSDPYGYAGAPAPGYPTPSYPGAAGPADPWSGPGVEVLQGGGQIVPPPRRRRVALTAGAVTVGVVGVAAASAYGYSLIGGGGDQPEQHLPGTAAAVLRIDLDPSLSQKVDALRFITKFPAAPHDLDWDKADRDPRKWLYEQLTKDTKDAPPWSEVQGWLGKRAAVAVMPASSGSPEAIPVLSLQVTDEAKATQTLNRTKGGSGVVAKDGWVLVSDSPEHVRLAQAATDSSPLSASPAFSEDVNALGDQGIASVWFDYGALSRIAGSAGSGGGLLGLNGIGRTLATQGSAAGQLKGHGAVALRFSGAHLELAGKLRGMDLPPGTNALPAAKINLPADSLAVFQMAGLGDAVVKAWPQLLKQVATLGKVSPDELTKQVQDQTGLKVPNDLRPLLGDQLGVAMRARKGGTPEFGVRVDSSSPDVKRVSGALKKLLADGGPAVTVRPFGGGYTLASTAAEADALAKGGNLADSQGFKDAVPDADGASVILYVDLAKTIDALGGDSISAEDRKTLDVFESVGFSARSDGDGAESFSLRLTTR